MSQNFCEFAQVEEILLPALPLRISFCRTIKTDWQVIHAYVDAINELKSVDRHSGWPVCCGLSFPAADRLSSSSRIS